MPDLRTAQGEPVTDEMLDALANEAEADYDPATLRPRRAVRTSKTSGSKTQRRVPS